MPLHAHHERVIADLNCLHEPIGAVYAHDIFVGNLRWHNPDNRSLLDFRHKRPLDYIAI